MIKQEELPTLSRKFDCRGNVNSLSCNQCSFSSHILPSLIQHRKAGCRNKEDNLNFLQNAYKCKSCDFISCSYIMTNKHEAKCCLLYAASNSDSASLWICSHCEFTISYKSLDSDKKFECGDQDCNHTATKIQELKLHATFVHLPDECLIYFFANDGVAEKSEQIESCVRDHCLKEFKMNYELDRQEFACDKRRSEQTETQLLCNSCEYKTKHKFRLRQHIMSKHQCPPAKRGYHVRRIHKHTPTDENIEDEEISVQLKTSRETRKENVCVFCNKKFRNIARHLEHNHLDEEDVAKFVALPKGSKERRQIIDLLRKNGNFENNKSSSEVIPVRLSRKGKTSCFIPCPRCRGYYSKLSLRKHYPHCQQGSIPTKDDRSLIVLGRRLSNNLHRSASPTLKTVMSRIRMDNIFNIIRVDPLIISFGNKLCKNLKSPHLAQEIRSKLRRLGRFLLTIKSLEPGISEFADIYNARYYQLCVQTAESMPENKSPLGALLKQVGRHARSYLKRNDTAKLKNLKGFMDLLKEDYGRANRTALQLHRRKETKLPTVEDLDKFYTFLCEQRSHHLEKLSQEGFSYETWKLLGSYTLTSIQVFNRGRPGESARMLVSDLENCKTTDFQYYVISVRGKLNTSVSMVVDQKALDCLNVVKECRTQAGVSNKNPYLFGLPGEDTHEFRHLDACALMRKFSKDCNLSDPSTLRATLLRKHMAAYCAAMRLNEVAHHFG